MIRIDNRNPEQVFEQFILNWFELIFLDNWDEAFKLIDLPSSCGEFYNTERFRYEIENDHFGKGTSFREEHPEIIYSNPKNIDGSGYPNIYPLSGSSDYLFEYDVPLNNEFSDLTSGWQFVKHDSFYKVRLEFLRVL